MQLLLLFSKMGIIYTHIYLYIYIYISLLLLLLLYDYNKEKKRQMKRHIFGHVNCNRFDKSGFPSKSHE